jgi:histidinol dehydrogenase|tara:strand:- start:262 stop:1536 length:1275 start_codon:yes stop_codon:yes gene_type:complete
MIKLFDCNKKNYLNSLLIFLEKRRNVNFNNSKKVSKIIKDIKNQKYKALLKYEKKFSKNSKILPTKKDINKAIKSLDPKVKRAIDFAYNRIKKFHLEQKKNLKNIVYIDKYKNKLESKIVPIKTLAVYVPGNLPSTLLMNALPAKLINVPNIILATPSQDGKLNPAVMYAAKKIGIKKIFSMGGAQAIASLAFIQKADKVIGPGNRFVAEAKRQLSGKIIGTETMFAGPSEICVLADKSTPIDQVITSLVSQAEHDPESQCILVTKDKNMITKVKTEIKKIAESIPRSKVAIKSLKKHSLIIHAKNDRQIIDSINLIAPEHLELNISNYKKYLNKIHNAGSICNGKYSPMSLSDYTVGTNHVLPTAGSAKFSSGLNINDFIKKISVVTLSKIGVEKIGNPAIKLSEFEKLFAHTLSIKSRIKRG